MISEPTWVIHAVFGTEKDCKEYPYSEFGYGNFHTHGLDKYNHPEICIPTMISQEIASIILNTCGLKIANDNKAYTRGIDSGILQGDFDVKFVSFEGDETLYMLLPDQNNKFPGDEGCEEPYNRQLEFAEYISKNKEYV